jgi:hypothetical protein
MPGNPMLRSLHILLMSASPLSPPLGHWPSPEQIPLNRHRLARGVASGAGNRTLLSSIIRCAPASPVRRDTLLRTPAAQHIFRNSAGNVPIRDSGYIIRLRADHHGARDASPPRNGSPCRQRRGAKKKSAPRNPPASARQAPSIGRGGRDPRTGCSASEAGNPGNPRYTLNQTQGLKPAREINHGSDEKNQGRRFAAVPPSGD